MAEPNFRKRVRYWIEGLGAIALFGALGALPLPAASAVGGFLARNLGPRTGASKRARKNLRRAMPELTDAEIERIVKGMWDNLGRVTAEYPHLGEFKVFDPNGHVETVGSIHRLKAHPPGPGERYIFFTAHYGNWEITSLALSQAGIRTVVIYRAANNPIVDRIILKARGALGHILISKGVAGRRAVAAMRAGEHLCLLVDQRMSQGITVPFFGRPAQTEKMLARLAYHYQCKVVPVRVERLGGVKFRLTYEEPMTLPDTGDVEADMRTLMTDINGIVERWVRERPDHWFWLHRRWGD